MKNTLPSVHWIVLSIAVVFFLSFFGLSIFPSFLDARKFFIVWIFLVLSFILYQKKLIFAKYIILINVFLFVNAIGCYINRGQSIVSTYEGWEMTTIGMINIYFVSLCLKNSIDDFEKILSLLSFLLCILYIVQFFVYPQVIFNSAELSLSKGMETSSDARIRVIGQALGAIAYYMGLNKFLIHRKTHYAIQALLGLTVVIMLGFRIQLLVLFIFSIILVVKIYGFSRKLILSLVFGFVFLYYIILPLPFVQDTIDHMINRQTDGYSENARYYTIYYYYNCFFNSNWEIILGAGLPGKGSLYSQQIDSLKESGIIFADLGIWGYSWVAGIPVALLLIIFPLVSLFKKMPDKYIYIGITMGFILFSSTYTREIYREGNPLLFGIMLAMQEKILLKYKSCDS